MYIPSCFVCFVAQESRILESPSGSTSLIKGDNESTKEGEREGAQDKPSKKRTSSGGSSKRRFSSVPKRRRPSSEGAEPGGEARLTASSQPRSQDASVRASQARKLVAKVRYL